MMKNLNEVNTILGFKEKNSQWGFFAKWLLLYKDDALKVWILTIQRINNPIWFYC